MSEDPIVQEVRDARAKHAERFNFDLRAIYEDFKKQERQSGRKIVSFPPKRIQPILEEADTREQVLQVIRPEILSSEHPKAVSDLDDAESARHQTGPTVTDDPTIAAIREARHKISASVDHDPYKLLEHYRKRQALNPERIVSLNNEVPSWNKALKLANPEVELSLQDVQGLRTHITQIIYRLPLESLTLLTEFASFLEAKLTTPFNKRAIDADTDASSVTPDDEFGLGAEIL